MKIAFVVHDYRRMEGHSRYVVELATRYAETHEVHVFANHIDTEGNSKIHFHHVPAWRRSALASILTFDVMATLRVLGKFDIIHNQGLCGLRGNVFTAHIANRAWHRALRKVAGRLTFRERVSGATLSALEYLFYRTARNVEIIAVSSRVGQDIRELYGSKAHISVVHHGVDLNSFSPAHTNPMRNAVRKECGLLEQEVAFLFVGDMRKGGRQCIQALSRLPDGKLMFISRSADAPYRALALELGVSERVIFLGVKERPERYYAASDVFLLPSHYDSFGMVVTEAMASALPVIVSKEAGVSELIQHGVNGMLLQDFTDPVELAGNMQLLAENRALAARIGLAGRRTAEDHSWDVTAAETMRVYERLLPGHKAAEMSATAASRPLR